MPTVLEMLEPTESDVGFFSKEGRLEEVDPSEEVFFLLCPT